MWQVASKMPRQSLRLYVNGLHSYVNGFFLSVHGLILYVVGLETSGLDPRPHSGRGDAMRCLSEDAVLEGMVPACMSLGSGASPFLAWRVSFPG